MSSDTPKWHADASPEEHSIIRQVFGTTIPANPSTIEMAGGQVQPLTPAHILWLCTEGTRGDFMRLESYFSEVHFFGGDLNIFGLRILCESICAWLADPAHRPDLSEDNKPIFDMVIKRITHMENQPENARVQLVEEVRSTVLRLTN